MVRLCSQLARPLRSGLGPLRQADIVEIGHVGRRHRVCHDYALHHGLALRARPLEPLPTLHKPSDDSVVLPRARIALRLQLRDLRLQLRDLRLKLLRVVLLHAPHPQPRAQGRLHLELAVQPPIASTLAAGQSHGDEDREGDGAHDPGTPRRQRRRRSARGDGPTRQWAHPTMRPESSACRPWASAPSAHTITTSATEPKEHAGHEARANIGPAHLHHVPPTTSASIHQPDHHPSFPIPSPPGPATPAALPPGRAARVLRTGEVGCVEPGGGVAQQRGAPRRGVWGPAGGWRSSVGLRGGGRGGSGSGAAGEVCYCDLPALAWR